MRKLLPFLCIYILLEMGTSSLCAQNTRPEAMYGPENITHIRFPFDQIKKPNAEIEILIIKNSPLRAIDDYMQVLQLVKDSTWHSFYYQYNPILWWNTEQFQVSQLPASGDFYERLLSQEIMNLPSDDTIYDRLPFILVKPDDGVCYTIQARCSNQLHTYHYWNPKTIHAYLAPKAHVKPLEQFMAILDIINAVYHINL